MIKSILEKSFQTATADDLRCIWGKVIKLWHVLRWALVLSLEARGLDISCHNAKESS